MTEQPSDQTATSSSGMSAVEDILDGEHETVFEDKSLVDPNTIVDDNLIYGRDNQLAAEARAFRGTLEGERPPDLLLYGPSGTGKTLTVKSVANKVKTRTDQKGVDFDFVSVNLKAVSSHTLDRGAWRLGKQTAKKAGVVWDVPRRGVATDAKFTRLYEIVQDHFDALVFILDEIDALAGRRDRDEPAYSELLYNLSRAMPEQQVDTQISTVVITNDPGFQERLDSRTDSSYNPTGIHFPDYDADELEEILRRRQSAFRDDALEDDVIPLVAAYGAQNDGDARRAIDLLRDAGELTDERGDKTVTVDHVEAANDHLVKNRVLEIVDGMSLQKKMALYAAAVVADINDGPAPSPAVYQTYQAVCNSTDTKIYQQESVNNHINKTATYGVLESERTSRGRNTGVRLEFSFREPPSAVIETLESDGKLSMVDTDKVRSVARNLL